MDVIVNGDRIELDSPELLPVLEKLGYECKKIVVAVNETFVPRDNWNLVKLSSGDRLDILGRLEGG